MLFQLLTIPIKKPYKVRLLLRQNSYYSRTLKKSFPRSSTLFRTVHNLLYTLFSFDEHNEALKIKNCRRETGAYKICQNFPKTSEYRGKFDVITWALSPKSAIRSSDLSWYSEVKEPLLQL